MKIISVINYKGGVGKTTTTANLAAELAWRGKRVLLLDLDPQTSLTFSFITPDDWQNKLSKNHTIKTWFDSFSSGTPIRLEDIIVEPPITNNLLKRKGISGVLHLIPSHLGLINVDLELATSLGGANMKQAKINFLKIHKRLSDGLKAIDKDKYDIVLMDCPPNFNITTKTAIVASDRILIPAKPDYLSTLGIDYLIRNLKELVHDYNEYAKYAANSDTDIQEPEINPEILGVVFTMIQIYNNEPIAAQRQFIAQTRQLGVPVFKSWFRENKTIFSDAPQYGIPVVLKAYNAGTHNDVVTEIEQFVTEFRTKTSL